MTFYGLRLGMSREEINVTRYGEMADLIACLQIYNGGVKQKKKLTDYQAIISLR